MIDRLSEKSKRFISDLEIVYRNYGLCLWHEDEHGAFIVRPFDEKALEWLRAGYEELEESRG